MKLYDKGLIDIKELMIKYLPLASNNGKGKITIENLLLNIAGLPVINK